jgi:hypothetical protein
MSSRWKVYRNKDKEKKYNISSDLHYPFRICILGSTGSGKTNLLMNLIFEEYAKILKRVVLMAGKPDTIGEMKSLHNENKPSFDMELFNKYNDQKVNEIMDKVEEDHKETVFIFEDLTAFNVFKKNSNNAIDRILMNGRQSLASAIFTAQYYKNLHGSARSINCSMLILFEVPDDEEKEKIYKEHKNGLSKEQFFKLLEEHTSEKFSFLAIDYTQPKESRFRDTNLNVIDLSKIKNQTPEGAEVLGEVIKGASKTKKDQSKSKPNKNTNAEQSSFSEKPAPNSFKKSSVKTEGKDKIKLKKLEKGDTTKMKAVFNINGKEKVVPFGTENRNFVEDKNNRGLRFDFIRRYDVKNEKPTDPRVLERYLLFESPDIKRNLKDYRDKFNV